MIFIFFFLPFALALYYVTPARFRNMALLLLSLFFYAWTRWMGAVIMIVSMCANYAFALLIDKYAVGRHNKHTSKRLFVVCVVFNLGLLLVFKYLMFIAGQIAYLAGFLHYSFRAPELLFPVGISFFTFKALSYLADVYRQDVAAETNFIRYSLYQSFFPQLLSGPIARYGDMESRLKARPFRLEQFRNGIERFIFGLGKKVLLANQLSVVADQAFSVPFDHLSPATAWLGALAYTLQLYFDFSGYTDMAIGIAKMLGFETPENFNYPYISRSIREFWRRWHITLSTWFRDYLYVPLGGNRKGAIRTYVNLVVVFLLCGLWHGANWTFIVWGLWHGLFLAFERTKFGTYLDQSPRILSHLCTILVIVLGWVFFRADSLTQAFQYFKAMCGFTRATSILPVLLVTNIKVIAAFVLALVGSTPWAKDLVSAIAGYARKRPLLYATQELLAMVVLFGVLIMCLTTLVYDVYKPFIYFGF
jgi:alginate O-acetyltransferase complex protein AlgI